MTTTLTLASAATLTPSEAITRFEAWAINNPHAPYYLKREKHSARKTYQTERTEAAYAGFIAGLTASGIGSIQAQFEAWVTDNKSPKSMLLSIEPTPYFNYALYKATASQHAYEGFIAAYEQRLQVTPSACAAVASSNDTAEILALRAALAQERELTAQLTAKLAKYDQLTHPELLYQALHAGIPARLPERLFYHLANRADDSKLAA